MKLFSNGDMSDLAIYLIGMGAVLLVLLAIGLWA
jgi:hypothetical protein